MNLSLPIVLLGSGLVLDLAAATLMAIAAVLFALLGVSCRRALAVSLAARIAFVVAVAGAATQLLAAELLLFLTGGAMLGYAVLALALTGLRPLKDSHALSVAMLLVAGDLALLELVMLLAKAAPDLGYAQAGPSLGDLLKEPLGAFCLVLGFGSRVSLVALCVPASTRVGADFALLPGWLLLGLCASAGALRLTCAGAFGFVCAAPLQPVLWWIVPLALVAWQLPRLAPRAIALARRAGTWSARRRDESAGMLAAIERATIGLPQALARIEARLTTWPVAMGGSVVLALVIAAVLMVGAESGL